MKPKSRCRLMTLASTDHCEVTRCEECGNIQMHVGPMAVRVPAHVFEDVVNCLNVAWSLIQKTVHPETREKQVTIHEPKH